MEYQKNSVVLCYPTGGTSENCFTESLVGALGHDGAHGNLIADVRSVEGLYIADNRDLAARRFMRYRLCATCRSVVDNGNKETATRRCATCELDDPPTVTPEWLWFVDTDVSFQSYDVLYQLLAHPAPVERPVVSALYFGYMDNGAHVVPIWFALTPDGRIEKLTSFSSGLNRLGVVGMGCCIIHRSVFEKFGDQYAHTGWLYFGHDVAPWVPAASVDNDFTPFGEDNCFCHRCIKLGIPLYGVGSIVVEHRKKRYENMQTFLTSFAQSNVDEHEKGTTLRLRRQPREASVRPTIQPVVGTRPAGPERGSQAGRIVGLDGTPLAVQERGN
jgi:hypothetical protein